MNFLSASPTKRITKQDKNQLPHILPEEVSNFPLPPVIQRMVTESLDHAILVKESSQPQSSYEAAATLTEFEVKKIMIDKMDKSELYLAAPEHRECYEGLIKSYDLDKTLFSTYDKVYSLKRIQKNKDKDEDPSARSDRGLKMRKTSKDAELTKGPKAKESQSGSSKGDKSQSKSSGKSVQSKEPEFEYSDFLIGHSFQIMLELEYDFERVTKPYQLKLDSMKNPWTAVTEESVSTMSYMTSIAKTKATQYDLHGIEDMVPNIWVPVKVAYDKHVLWESHIRENNIRPSMANVRRSTFLRINEQRGTMLFSLCSESLYKISQADEVYLILTIAFKNVTRRLGCVQKRVEDPNWESKDTEKIIFTCQREAGFSEKKRANIMVKEIDKATGSKARRDWLLATMPLQIAYGGNTPHFYTLAAEANMGVLSS
ncbi:hypothetical protein Tco_0640455 [Tanacetum coccineum]